MKLQDLIIDPRSLGNKFWLVDVLPAYEYRDNRRTENVIGHRYAVCMVDKGLDKIAVRIDGQKLLDAPESGYTPVTFTGLEVFLYWQNGTYQIGAKATGVSVAGNNKG